MVRAGEAHRAGEGATGWADPAQLLAAMHEAVDQGVALQVPAPSDSTWVTRQLQQLAQLEGATAWCLPLPGAPEPQGALLALWQGGCPRPELLAQVALEAGHVSALIEVQRRAAWPWHRHLRDAARQSWRQGIRPVDARGRRRRNAAVLVLAGLTLLPLPHQVSGPARIEGEVQRLMSAPADGFIQATHARPGDVVRQGALLVDLAAQDLQLTQERWRSQVAQFDNAYAAAMTRGDRGEAAISLSRLEEAQAQQALAEEQLQRARIVAPFDGVVVQGDLSQSVGAPVKQGDTLMTLASQKGRRLIIDVEERDIARVKAGLHGTLRLSATPWDGVAFEIRRITPQAVHREGRTVYEVEAWFQSPLPRESAEKLRPGLLGHARIDIGHQPLLWSWLTTAALQVRRWTWAWWP